MKINQQPLRFGQIVSIKPSDISNMFLTSDGYIKTKAQLFEIEKNKVACGTLFFQSLFQIYPKFTTTRLEQVQNLEQELAKSKYSKEATRQQKLQDMEEKVIQEYRQNIEASNKVKNQMISQSQAIQFLHISSNKYLACNYTEADGERENFKLELNEFPSDCTCFKLVAAFTHYHNGLFSDEPVYIIMDKIYLGLKPYVHLAKEIKQYDNSKFLSSRTLFNFPNEKTLDRKIQQGQMKYKGIKIDPTNIQEPTTHFMLMPLDYKKKQDLEQVVQSTQIQQYILKREVNVSLEHKSIFQISIFSDPIEDENQICYGDVIQLNHIELNAILVTMKNQSDEIIVSLQQTKNDQLGEFIGNTYGMWQIEHLKLAGGPVEWGQLFRLRHFSLGKYLAIHRVGEMNSCFYLDDNPNENSLIQFLPLPSSINENKKYVTKDAFFKLKGANEWIQFLDHNHDSEIQIVMLRLSDNCKDDDVLKCQKATLSEIQETSFLISCFPVLRKSLIMFKHLQIKDLKKLSKEIEKSKFTKKMTHLEKVLEDLTRFCNNQFLMSNQNRQKVLKEQYFIDILLEILCHISDEDQIKQYLDNYTRRGQRNKIKDDSDPSREESQRIITFKSAAQQLKNQSQLMKTVQKAQKDHSDKQFKLLMQSKFEAIRNIYKLLISICKNNNENEYYVYNKVVKFNYQAKFFKETTDFIISLLQNNENLLSNLLDDVKLNQSRKRRETLSIDSNSFQSHRQSFVNINEKNGIQSKNMVIFYKNLCELNKQSLDCLQFFRCISKYGNKGLSVNQEMIHSIMVNSDKFRESLFLPIEIKNNQLLVYVNGEEKQIKQLDIPHLEYLVSQLNLYSDLALSRNFLWRTFISNKFQQDFVFTSIFDEQLPLEVRSALCNIGLTVYIDHEPFNLLIVPNLCRLIHTRPFKSGAQINYESLTTLVQKVMESIHNSYNQTKDEMNQKAKQKKSHLYKIEKSQEQNQFQLDIVRLTKTLIQFDIVNQINRKEIYHEILPPLIFFLEYDRNNFLVSYILNHLREEQINKAKSSLKKLKGMVTSAIDIGRNLVAIINKKDKLEEEFAQQSLFSKHPIVQSLLTLTSYIQQFSQDQSESISKIDIEMKLQICDLLIFFQELRLDFLITNFLQFYQIKQKKGKDQLKLKQELEQELISILPPTLRTGIEETNQKGHQNLFSALGDAVHSVGKMIQQRKFTNYSGEVEMPDLDGLMSGVNKDIIKSAVLPSLLVTFYQSNDSLLSDKVLEVIRRCFTQKQELFENLRNLEILFESTEINCYYMIQNLLVELRAITESSEVWLSDLINFQRGDTQQITKLKEIVVQLNSLLYKHTVVTSQLEIQEQENNAIISPTRQKIFTYLSGHVPLVNFIRDSQNQLSKILKDKEYSNISKKVVLDLMGKIYLLLNHFCKNEVKNQNILIQHLDLFLDEVEEDYGQIQLVAAIYKDNRFLCENISNQRIQQMLQFITLYGRQSRFLELLKVIQVVNKQNLVENQLKILQHLLPHQKDEDFTRNELWLYGQFQKMQAGITFDFRTNNQNLNEPYLYHMKLIEVLLQTTYGEESFKLNTPKLKQILKLGYLVELLLMEDNFIVDYFPKANPQIDAFKEKIILFINWIYLKNDLTHQEVIIKEQLWFVRLFEFELDRLVRLQQYSQREKYIKYFYDHLIILLTSYCEKMIAQTQEAKDRDREDYLILCKIMDIILSQTDTSILMQQLSKHQVNNLHKFISVLDDQKVRSLGSKLQQCIIQSFEFRSVEFRSSIKKVDDEPQIKSIKKPQIIDIFNQEEKKFLPDFKKQEMKYAYSEVTNRKNRLSIKKISSQQQQLLWANQTNWKQFLEMCENSETLKEQARLEIKTLSFAIYNIDKLMPDNLKKQLNIQLDFKSFIRIFIKYIEQGISQKAKKENLIYSLQLLEEILNFDELEDMQNLFDQQNATKMILNIIADYKNNPFEDDFFNQLLSFGCKLCEGGNPKVQKTIFQYFSNWSQSENIFQKFNFVFNDHVEELKMKYKTQNEKKKEEKEAFRLETDMGVPVDFQPIQDEEQIRDQQTRADILVNLLRFVQLFCEGHNLELQNYIRQQFNSRNNYNLVQTIVELLFWYHLEIDHKNYNNILKCLDTLTEFIQGPCTDNQQTIIDSKFLEVANTLLSQTIPKANKQQQDSKTGQSEDFSVEKKSQTNLSFKSKNSKQFKKQYQPNIERYMLERIKFKVMVLVTSLLELNSDSLAIKRIMRSLPIEILKKNLKSIYKKYKKLYGNTYTQYAFKHVQIFYYEKNNQMESDIEDKKLPQEYHEMIVETGFYIYFLISYYSELDMQEIDQETSNELQIVKYNQEDQNLFMDNIVGQLIRFSFQIVGGILGLINKIREYLQKKLEKKIKQPLAQHDQEKRQLLKRNYDTEIFRETIKFFAENTAHIEVVRYNQIERIHFFKQPYCKYLPPETKKEFHETVNRDSTNSKITDLIDQTNSIIQVCKHEETLAEFFSKNQFIAIFANYVVLWRDLAFMLTLFLNVFIILSYSAITPTGDNYDDYQRVSLPQLIGHSLTVEETKQVFNICGYMMIVCSTFVVLFFLLKKAPLYIKEAWRTFDDNDHGLLINTLIEIFAFFYSIVRIFLNIEIIYYLAYGALSYVATFVHPFFFAFHLTEVVIRFPTLRNIIKSFWEPKTALFLTFVLIILFNYFFTIIAYIYLYEYYQGRCETLLYCFLDTFDQAFKNNGGIGGWFEGNIPQDPHRYNYGRFFYDNLYNLLIVTVLIQIFSGIIIDRFSSLREKQMQREADKQETCFICGQSREIFDRKSEAGFKLHTEQEHFMWNYVFYIAYLRDKEVTEYTGIESYIAERLNNYDNSWIPIGKALGLKNIDIDNPSREREKIASIQQEMDGVKYNVQEILKNMEQLNNQIQ